MVTKAIRGEAAMLRVCSSFLSLFLFERVLGEEVGSLR